MRIFVAGHRGMVGGAITRQLLVRGDEVITRSRAELDLLDSAAVRAFMATERPDAVVMAAAKVGGIHANNTYPAEFIINLGCGSDVTIAELAGKIAEVTGFTGRIAFDTGKPDGTMRKLMDVSRLAADGLAGPHPAGPGPARNLRLVPGHSRRTARRLKRGTNPQGRRRPRNPIERWR